MDLVIERLKILLERVSDLNSVTILLETMSGKGAELGNTLKEIKYMVGNVQSKKVGVCLDTCHLHDGGYTLDIDLINKLEDFGLLCKVHCLHVNGSENVKGSKKDRHIDIFNPNNKIDKEIIYNFTNLLSCKGVLCILEKPLEYIGTEIEFLKYHTGFDENYIK